MESMRKVILFYVDSVEKETESEREEAVAVAKVKAKDSKGALRPALTPEARENQMISLAVDLAEKQLREGTASSQVITHFLKLGSSKEKLEKEILEKQKEMIAAKTESLQSAKRVEELYSDAMNAFRKYSGNGGDVNEDYGGY